jgi:uncharacterized MAPEG superfamily protein
MQIEYLTLAASVVLGFIYLFAAVHLATKQRGMEWNVGSREGEKPLHGAAFPFFVAAILTAGAANRFSNVTIVGAQSYFWARLLYLPAYGFDIRFVRSALWITSVAGIFAILVAMLP